MKAKLIYEYEVTCETCGVKYDVGLSGPAESIDAESLARVIDRLHPHPKCAVTR